MFRLSLIRGLVFFIFSFFIFHSSVLASVLINEFMPDPEEGEEWVEFYNPEGVDLSEWIIEEKTSSGNFTSHKIGDNLSDNEIFDIYSFSSSKLNNDGDTLRLKNGETIIDEYSYSQSQKGKSFARIPDSGSWEITSSPTKGKSNVLVPLNSPSVSPSSVSVSPSPSSLPAATYKIGEVKDKNGKILNNVKIYIDNVYINHYAPETLNFCQGCSYGGFGQHTIKLEKTGYEDWLETREITPGSLYEVYPVMNLISVNPSPSLVSSFKPSALVSVVPLASVFKGPSPLSLIKNETSFSPFPLETASPLVIDSPSVSAQMQILGAKSNFNPKLLLAFGFIGLGIFFLLLGFLPEFLKKIKKRWYTQKI